MKKLTKVLSLVLVIAMVVSLCVVGVSAKTDFADQTTINAKYVEAVDVMSGIGIIEGTGNGFEPTGNFTRAAAAKIITYMQLGAKSAEALTQKATFADSVNHWATTYIAYCAQQGIINGYNAQKFGPDDTLTGYQWTKMLLCAVGFGMNKEYVGANWSINAARDGMKYGVYTDVLEGATPEIITREVATMMAFNTLTGIAKVTYSPIVGDYVNGNAISGVSTTGTLGTTVYRLMPFVKANVGVNGHIWIQGTTLLADKSNIVSAWYQDDVAVGTINTATTARAFKADYTKTMFADSVDYWYNGDQLADVSYASLSGVAATDIVVPSGSTVVMYDVADAQGHYDGIIDKIVVTEEYIAIVSATNAAAGTYNVTGKVALTDLDNTNGYTKGQVLLVVPTYTDGTGFVNTDKFISESVATVAATGKIAAIGANNSYVTVDGTKYPISHNFYAAANTLTVGNICDIYLDSTGAVAYAVVKDSAAAATYCYVEAYAGAQATLAGTPAYANAQIVTTEGKTVVAKLATYTGTDGKLYYGSNVPVETALAAGYYTYTVNEDGTYTFAALGAKAVGMADTEVVAVVNKQNTVTVAGTTKLVSSASVLSDAGNGIATATTGYANWATKDYTAETNDGTLANRQYVIVTYADTAKTVVAAIYAFKSTAVNTTTYAYCTGAIESTSAGTSYGFYVDGKYVTYVVATGATPVANSIYTIVTNGTTAVVTDAEVLTQNATVTAADVGYFVSGNAAHVYGTNCKIYDMTTADGATVSAIEPTALTADSATTNGDTVTFVTASNAVTVVYVIAHN